MIVEVHFFGTAKQFFHQIPPDVERDLPQISLPEGTTLEDLLRILGVRSDRARPLISLNGRHQRSSVVLRHQDRIELVPPMAGGMF